MLQSKKYQSMEDQRTDADSQACAQDQMKDIQLNRSANENTAKVVLNVPPHDLSASTPEKAYLLNKIIPKDEWKHLNNILEMVIYGKDLDTTSEFYRSGTYPCFVVNRLGKIRETKVMPILSNIVNHLYLLYGRNLSVQFYFILLMTNELAYHSIILLFYQNSEALSNYHSML